MMPNDLTFARMARLARHSGLGGRGGRPPLAERVVARRARLELALERLDFEADTIERLALEAALAAVEPLLTGDIERPSDVVAHELANWLERTRNFGLVAPQSMSKCA